MSIEALLTRVAEALEANAKLTAVNNELLEKVNAGRDAAIAVAEKAAGAAATTSTRRKPAETKAEPEQPAEETKAAPAEKVEDYTGDAGFDALRKLAGGYLNTDDAGEHEARGTMLTKALTKLNAASLGKVAEGDRATLAGWLKILIAGEDVAELADEPKTNSLLD